MTAQGQEVQAAPRLQEAPRAPAPGAWRKYALAAGFLAPAAFFLLVWIVYPTFETIQRSFYDRPGDTFVGLDNYETLFTEDRLLTAIKNSALWIFVVPALVTAIGLIFAVLTERIRWAVAFKTVVFMPMAISAFAAGVLWRIMYIQDPERGALNSGISALRDVVSPTGPLSTAQPSTEDITGTPAGGLVLEEPAQPGAVAQLGLTAIRAAEVPEDSEQAVVPEPLQGGITGVVWRDFKPGGGTPGEVEQDEIGLPGVKLVLRDAGGKQVATAKAADDGTFAFEGVEAGEYTVGIAQSTFAEPFDGFNWLGDKLITPAIMFAFIWVNAGFAMVIIGAGLASISRETLEAARTDGATEWQVFRRVTIPQLTPVLIVVFVTQIIGVLKIFDLVLAIAPGSTQDDAATLAFVMWQRSFSGQNLFGLGAAIATFILLLFIPFLIVNIRRFRADTR